MKLERSKEWYERRIAGEGNAEVGAGTPPRSPLPAAEEVGTKREDEVLSSAERRNKLADEETMSKVRKARAKVTSFSPNPILAERRKRKF
jgi:hypothetical protein